VTARAIMVFGTSSHVGKSLLTAALFRAGRSSRRAF
jgi:cobyric acid synthase